MLALCWHNVPACYALNYAGIFDGGLEITMYLPKFMYALLECEDGIKIIFLRMTC